MTRIAILETGRPPEHLRDAFDDYPARFRALLGEGRAHVHEPAYAPDPADYVSWDYARGYVDAVLQR